MSTPSADIVTGNNYDKYASKNPVERRIMSSFFAALDRALPTDRPSSVLEVGVGEGEVTEVVSRRFGGLTIAGIDLPDDDLAARWTTRPVAGSFADIAHLPFPDDHFDLVLGIEVLEHVPDPAAALREIARVGRRHVVLSVPREPIWRIANMARGKYLSDLGNTPGHVQHWSSGSFERLIGSRFDVELVQRPFPWTMVTATIRN